jgi:flagellar biosynthesis protein FliR
MDKYTYLHLAIGCLIGSIVTNFIFRLPILGQAICLAIGYAIAVAIAQGYYGIGKIIDKKKVKEKLDA